MEISSRDLSNDMAEHRPISKNNQNTHYSLIFQDWLMFCNINTSSRRDLCNHIAEHRSILKSNQNTYYPRLIFAHHNQARTRQNRCFMWGMYFIGFSGTYDKSADACCDLFRLSPLTMLETWLPLKIAPRWRDPRARDCPKLAEESSTSSCFPFEDIGFRSFRFHGELFSSWSSENMNELEVRSCEDCRAE